jgi:hypothetical protein
MMTLPSQTGTQAATWGISDSDVTSAIRKGQGSNLDKSVKTVTL